jgi:UDP:flavonoid glycosyltransferase YjiC (YdhE family)
LHNKLLVREFNKVASHYHVAPFRYTLDLLLGDHTLMCDDINFLGIQPSKEFPLENFIGPLIPRNSDEKQPSKIDADIEHHLQRPGRSIVLAMGSAYNYRNLFPVLIETLSKTDYNVIAVYKDIQNSDLRIKTRENILLKEFIPLDIVLKKVDLAITHGGRGTIYTVAYAGKPAICIPIIAEQQFNIDNLVRAGAGICLSKKKLDSNKVLKAIDTIFDNYAMFLEHSQRLSKRLSGEEGEEKAVQRLLEIHRSHLRT